MSKDRAQYLSEVAALAHRLVEIVNEQMTHQVALDVLISAYVSVAVCHPCCAQSAAATARQMADYIQNSVAPRPVGANHLH